MQAGHRITLVDVGRANRSGVSRKTTTGKAIEAIKTSSPIGARGAFALVDVKLALMPGIPGGAGANKPVHSIAARATVEARIDGRAIVDVCFTISASESSCAAARESVDAIAAKSTVGTWAAGTLVDVYLALVARVTR